MASPLSYEPPLARGCGKREETVVAGLAMYAAASAGRQAAQVVPTEILATQLQNLFPDEIALLTGGLKATEKREALERNSLETAQLIVGTHVIQEGFTRSRFGRDEQRLGTQRRILRRTKNPDVPGYLFEPWPSRLLEIWIMSIIDQMPAGQHVESSTGS